MENNVKKLSAILLCCLMIITCSLAGCATFSIDRVKYYNEVVATVGEKNITRSDLLSAYNSYGYSYFVSQDGQTETEAMNSTLDILIDRELLYQYALDNDATYRPTAYQVNNGIQTMFDSLDEQMDTYVEESKRILNIEINSDNSNSDETDEETAYLYEDYVYTKRAEVKSRTIYYTDSSKTEVSSTPTEFSTIEYYIEYISEEEPDVYDKLIDESYLNDFNKTGIIDAIIEKYFTDFKDNLTINEKSENVDLIYNKVRSLLAEDLISYEYYLRDENGKEYSKNTEDLIYRYFERNFESQIQSIYLTNIQTYFLENENLSIQALLDEYNYLTQAGYLKYRNHEETYKTDLQDIGTSADTIYYHPTNLSDGTKFGYVIHTLINVDGLNDALTALEENAEIKDNPELYEREYNRIISEYLSDLKIAVRDENTGLISETETKTFNEVLAEYNEITKISDYETKLNEFIKFMFKYTGDASSSLVSGMPYVVGTNGYSTMEEAFTEEAERLINAGIKGGTTPASTENLCVSSYGVHFLFYVGEVGSTDYYIPYSDRDSVYIQSDNRADNGRYNLYYKILNPLTGETYFDMLFDAVYPAESDESNYSSNTGYSDYEENLINTSMISHKVVKYTTKINSTKTSI